jgi:hypothetical protein
MGALSSSHDRSLNRRHGRLGSTVGCHKKLRSILIPLLEEPSSCSTLKKRELSLRSFLLAKESEEHGLKENSRTVKIDPITRKFQGMALTQPVTSETHQAEQEILAHPSDGKKMPMSRISSDAILNKLQNRLSGPALPTVPCILGPFKVHHVLCDWGASMNILPKMVYGCLDEDPLVPTLINCDWQTPQ